MESHIRTLAKSVSYRSLGFVLTTLIAWIVTGRVEIAASIGLLDTIFKLGAFYFHERLWLKVNFGRGVGETLPVKG